MEMRLLAAFGQFWCVAAAAILVMGDPGMASNPAALLGIPLLATVGLFVGPIAFVAGAWGLTHGGYGSGGPAWWWLWVSLAYLGHALLFAGAVFPKSRLLRYACVAVESACALVAAKGVAYCI